ncbi:hypothetical protein L596_021677 [Steinernema carpocapsae]|uniref:Uncharacterized protein n=1 Tax=Steinernema carpocapsae TaxID=34508 RepID=A0A4U5MJT4_STECR|nr:hypothetical protein L596_021677 [Steinernema carpocapsae]
MRLSSEILFACILLVAVFARPETTETDFPKMSIKIVKGDVETDLPTRVKRQFYVPDYYPPVGAYYAPRFPGGYYPTPVNPYFYG